MINWIATNTTGSYIVSQKSYMCHITSSLLQHVLKMSASSTNAKKARFQMLHECQEAASVSKRRRDNTPIGLGLTPGLRTWMLLAPRLDTASATEIIMDLLKFDWLLKIVMLHADESHWCLSF